MTRTTSTTDPSPIAARLLESHPTPTFTVDAQTRILTWNARMEAVTGRRAEDVVGQRAWSAFFERKAPTPIDEAILGGTAVSRPFQLAHPRGEQASVVFRAEAVVDAAGDVIGAIGTLDEPEVETTGSGAFAAVVDAIMSVQEPSAVPGAALEHIRGAYGWRFGAWWTLTDAKGFRIQGESGSIDNAFIRGFRDHGMPADTGLLGRAAAQRDVVAVADLGQVADSPRAVAAHRAGIRSAVVIPVQRGGKVIGVIDLIGRENPVDESEIDQLRAIARGIGHQMDLTTEVRRGHRLGTAIDNAANAIMLISSDFTITYANPASIRLLESYRAELQGLYPGFEPQGIVGINIDRFHKDPRHQRRLLGDSANLPWRSDIRVGPLTFDIQVTASHHTDGAIEGYCLEWRDVTKLRKEEDQVAALRSQIEGSSVSVMLADTDRRITYVNPACRALLSGNTAEMRRYFPGFDANGLVGRCIDDFHANPRHQQSILAGVGHDPIRRDISVGSMRFGLNLVGLRDNADKIIGYAVEWTDQSDRYKYAAEVKRVVDALTNGDLSAHGDVAAMSEMFKPMMGNLNQVIDTLKQPLVLALRYIRAISVGESPEAIDGDYRGDFATLIGAINRLIEVDASIAESAARMAGGDLTVALTPRSDADELLHSLSRMVDNMSTNLRGVRGAADRIAVGSTQVSGASRSVSDEATRAAASVEEISASVEELATQTRYNADNAASAMRLATASCDAAKEGDQQMQSMVRAMGEIDEASQNISRIIKVIDEIAFQTNLLALNAAVEAARAGVHGKGFAVVAEEVRNLAARSARAAKETTEMIEGSLKKVQLGTSLANETARALAGIVDSITQAAELVAQIARASNEQAEGINQINEGLTQVDSVIQQNTANAEEMAAAAVELSSESERLKEMLSAFRLREPQRATDGVQGLSPEMLEAFQQFMARYNGGGAPAPAAPAKERRPAAASPAASMGFDDLDFGKF